MNGIEECLLFTVVGCLAFLIFSIKKLLDDLRQSERTIWEQREEVRRLSLTISEWERNFYDNFDDDDSDSEGEETPFMEDWDDDLPF